MSVAASPPPSRSPSPEPPPALAQELIDLILDFLHSDRRTLLSASLAARAFVPRARHHLFRKIVLSRVPHRGAATAAIRDTVTSFLELGKSEWWSFGGAVAEVLVGIDGRLVRDSPSSGVVEEVFQVLARAGAPLRKVLFIDANVDAESPRPLAWLARRFPGLTELVYNGTTAPSARFPSDAYELLSGLSELRTLALYTASAYSSITPLLNLPVALRGGIGPLTTLRVRFHAEQLDAFIARLLPHARGLHLETLDVVSFFSYHSGWGPVENLNALLATQARTLRDLTVQIAYEDMDGEEMDEAARLGQASQGDHIQVVSGNTGSIIQGATQVAIFTATQVNQ
ncbi:hypothetical protein MKEN_00476800 [Mycena kentingensis (nom. inval.)]|nr:hypothetical protein MKEN_00476800 [Mycena kentingensis (nom. inval.)]